MIVLKMLSPAIVIICVLLLAQSKLARAGPFICETSCDPPTSGGTVSCCGQCLDLVDGGPINTGSSGSLCTSCANYASGQMQCQQCTSPCTRAVLVPIYRYSDQSNSGDHIYSQASNLQTTSIIYENVVGYGYTGNVSAISGLMPLTEYTKTGRHYYTTSGAEGTAANQNGFTTGGTICWIYGAPTTGVLLFPVYRFYGPSAAVYLLTMCPYDVGTSSYWQLQTTVGYMLIR